MGDNAPTFQAKLHAKLFRNIQLFYSCPMFLCMAYCSCSKETWRCSWRSHLKHLKYSKTIKRPGLHPGPNWGSLGHSFKLLLQPFRPQAAALQVIQTPFPIIPHFQILFDAIIANVVYITWMTAKGLSQKLKFTECIVNKSKQIYSKLMRT